MKQIFTDIIRILEIVTQEFSKNRKIYMKVIYIFNQKF